MARQAAQAGRHDGQLAGQYARQAWLGMVWRGGARQGEAWQGKAGEGNQINNKQEL